MVTLDDSRENFIEEGLVTAEDALEEERRTSGRYLAAGLVIFLVALGLYHAVHYGSTKLSALLGAALIMFLYLLWLLYASQRKKISIKVDDFAVRDSIEEIQETKASVKKFEKTKNHPAISRSYSIA